jgi:hypothetical protein
VPGAALVVWTGCSTELSWSPKVASVIRALWHTLRLGHSVRRDEMIYPGVRTHVYFCSCGDSWGAPPGYRDGEYRGPHGF